MHLDLETRGDQEAMLAALSRYLLGARSGDNNGAFADHVLELRNRLIKLMAFPDNDDKEQ